jgi:mRNA interferase RelE/StbE
MKIIQSRSFARRVKKFSKAHKLILDEQIKLILKEPLIGIEKKGDLKEVFVHKFKIKTIQYLLAYRFSQSTLELIMIGPHQNYYRDLKRNLKNK